MTVAKGRTVVLDLDEFGEGKVIVDGKDISHLSRRVHVLVRVGQPTLVRIELIAVATAGRIIEGSTS